MDLLQTWLIVGVPGLVVAAALFVGRSRWRTWAGYVVLATTAVVLATVGGDLLSAAAVGLVGFLTVASGRGLDEPGPEEHEHRERYTTDPSHA